MIELYRTNALAIGVGVALAIVGAFVMLMAFMVRVEALLLGGWTILALGGLACGFLATDDGARVAGLAAVPLIALPVAFWVGFFLWQGAIDSPFMVGFAFYLGLAVAAVAVLLLTPFLLASLVGSWLRENVVDR